MILPAASNVTVASGSKVLNPSPTAPPAPAHYLALDSLRGIGALMIVLYHSRTNSSIWGTQVFANLYLFVDFFFVLSGFVIAANYQSRIVSLGSLGEFMRRRFWRLYPLHVSILVAYIALELAELVFFDGVLGGVSGNSFSGDRSIPSIFTNLLLVHSLGLHDNLTWNYPSWSISTEFYTYLGFGLVAMVLAKRVGWAAVAAMFLLPFLLLEYSQTGMRTTWDLGFVRCILGFSGGVVVWNFVSQFSLGARFSLGSTWAFSVAEIIAVAAIVGFLAYADERTAILIPFLFMFAVLVFTSDRGIVSRMLATKPFLYLGLWSYSIYMVHSLVGDIGLGFSKVLRKLGVDLIWTGGGETLLGPNVFAGNLLLLLYVAVAIVIASLTYRFIEVPGRDFGRRPRRESSAFT